MKINFFAAAVLLIAALSCSTQKIYPVLGKMPVKTIGQHEVKSEALLAWMKADIKGATVLSINARSGLGSLDAGALKDVRGLSGKRDRDRLDDFLRQSKSPVSAENYLGTAMDSGLVSKVYWVLPGRLFNNILTADVGIKDFLRSSGAGLTKAEIDGMKMKEGCLSGNIRGKQLFVCGFSTLYLIREPVVLDIGVDFFPVMSAEYGINKLGAMKTLFESLELRDIKVARADVTYGIRDGLTRPIHRFLGEETVGILQDPNILKTGRPPDLWAARDTADNMFSGGGGDQVLSYLKEPMKKFRDDPALIMLEASALLRTGKGERALDNAEMLCKTRREYCEGLVYLAYLSGLQGNEKMKKSFLNTAAQYLPSAEVQKALRYDMTVSRGAASSEISRGRY